MVVILMDGYRWKELSRDADSALLFRKKTTPGLWLEVKTEEQIYQDQFAQTIAKLLGFILLPTIL